MSIEVMKQALEALDSDDPSIQLRTAVALRQAIEQAEKQEPVIGTKTWFEDGKVVTQHLHPSDIYKDLQPKQEPVAFYGDQPLYAKRVHASDISQERVDETAKDRHEPESNNVEIAAEQSDNYAAFLAGVRFARVNLPAPSKEWVGLATGEAKMFYDSDLNRADLIDKIDEFLEEKNK